jgi:hypothetical protein
VANLNFNGIPDVTSGPLLIESSYGEAWPDLAQALFFDIDPVVGRDLTADPAASSNVILSAVEKTAHVFVGADPVFSISAILVNIEATRHVFISADIVPAMLTITGTAGIDNNIPAGFIFSDTSILAIVDVSSQRDISAGVIQTAIILSADFLATEHVDITPDAIATVGSILSTLYVTGGLFVTDPSIFSLTARRGMACRTAARTITSRTPQRSISIVI